MPADRAEKLLLAKCCRLQALQSPLQINYFEVSHTLDNHGHLPLFLLLHWTQRLQNERILSKYIFTPSTFSTCWFSKHFSTGSLLFDVRKICFCLAAHRFGLQFGSIHVYGVHYCRISTYNTLLLFKNDLFHNLVMATTSALKIDDCCHITHE